MLQWSQHGQQYTTDTRSKRTQQGNTHLINILKGMMDESPEGAANVADLLHRRASEGLVLSLATGCKRGSLFIQRVIEESSTDAAVKLAWQLSGHVAEVAMDLNGNRVMEKIIRLLPLSKVSFILEDLSQTGHTVLQDKLGVRTILRLVENFGHDAGVERLTNGFLENFDENVTHEYAHHVIEAGLEHGTAQQKHNIADRLKNNFFKLAKDPTAWHVVDKALHSELDLQDTQGLISMATTPGALARLAKDRCGGFIVNILREMPECKRKVEKWLETPSVQADLCKSKFGKKFYMERAFRPTGKTWPSRA